MALLLSKHHVKSQFAAKKDLNDVNDLSTVPL